MTPTPSKPWRRSGTALAGLALLAALPGVAVASDHLDSPAVIADPRADIGDVYAWMSPDKTRLNLVMTIVGHSFSDQLDYVFHVDSAGQYGAAGTTTTVTCRFRAMDAADCRIGDGERMRGDASGADGLSSHDGRAQLFAGLRDDPFFNNVRGSRAAYDVAAAAVKDHSAPYDAAGCPALPPATSAAMMDQWRHTQGGPASDLLAGWTPASIVLSLDIGLVNRGGPMLAVWGATVKGGEQIDRFGRPLTANALLATLGPVDEADRLKLAWNATSPDKAAEFVPAVEQGLGLYDGFDGACGNQLLAGETAAPHRYRRLAELLVDDRLWIDSRWGDCNELFGVERAALTHDASAAHDCGGRRLNLDAVDVWRALLVNGTSAGVSDGVDHDALTHSETVFPFLAPPAAKP